MSTFVNFNIIDEKFFLWLSFEIHLNFFIFKLEWNVAFILFSVLIVFFSHFSLWLRMLFTRISCTITTLIWRFRFVFSQMFFVQSSSFFNVLRDFSLLILSTMISSKWYRVVSMFFRELCFVSMSRVFFTIFFDVIFCVNWIFFCSITLIAIFSSLFEENVDVFLAFILDMITATSHRAIVAQILLFFEHAFFFFAIFFNRVVISFNFLIVFVDLNIDETSFVRVMRDVLINWSRTLIIFFVLNL